MWFMLAIGLWLYVRLGGTTRGKWRILDGKVESVRSQVAGSMV
jgi:hypothetical protein